MLARQAFASLRTAIRSSSLLCRSFGDSRRDYEKNESFGFQKVPSEERQSLVNAVFSNVASAYDVMNDLMSLGVHRCWKVASAHQDYFVTEVGALRPKRIIENGKIVNYEQVNIIDVAGGTGDIAFKILEKQKRWDSDLKNIKVPASDQVTVYDINGEMLKVGQQNAASRGFGEQHLE